MAKKRKISAREFSRRFTKIIADHLSALPAHEQDKRIRNAERAASKFRHGVPATTQRAEEISQIHLSPRTRE